MDIPIALSGCGTVLAGTAAWAALWSPRAKAARMAADERDQRAREVHEALYGVEERRDNAGALITPGRPGVLADMRTVMDRLSAPLLNGKGNDLIVTVARLDRRTLEMGRHLSKIDKQLAGEK